jgi:hypothetical protein
MVWDCETKKKRPYSPPSLTTLTLEQAKELVADRRKCGEEEAHDFLKSVRQQQRARYQEGKRST